MLSRLSDRSKIGCSASQTPHRVSEDDVEYIAAQTIYVCRPCSRQEGLLSLLLLHFFYEIAKFQKEHNKHKNACTELKFG